MRSLAFTAILSVPVLALATTAASARPMMAGLSAGLDQSEADVGVHDPSNRLGLFGRLGLTNRLSGQLEVSRVESNADYDNWKTRKITALLVVDLRDRGPLVPVLLVGTGIDQASTSYGDSASATHVEGGFGLEYRATGGVVIGGDLRMGGRSIEQSEQPVIALYAPTGLVEGEYRTARLTLAISF